MAEKSITLLGKETALQNAIKPSQKTALIAIGDEQPGVFSKELLRLLPTTTIYKLSDNATKKTTDALHKKIKKGKYKNIIVSISNFSIRPTNNYGFSNAAINFAKQLQKPNSLFFLFGNVLALKNFCWAKNMVVCYQDDNITQQAAVNVLFGKIKAQGTLPVTVCKHPFGSGLLKKNLINKLGKQQHEKLKQIDSVINDAINKKSFSGLCCVCIC